MTGSGGFAGRYLMAELLRQEVDAYGLVRRRPEVSSYPEREIVGDLLDAPRVAEIVAGVRPDQIYHLAGQASVSEAWQNPAATLQVNQLGQLHLIESVIKLDIRPRILSVGSNEEYGIARAEDLPLREDTPLRPANPYAVSKIGQGFQALQYWLSHRLPIVRVRPFNHTGPGQDPRYVVPSIGRQVAEIEMGLREPIIRTGNPETQRDFTDVRDIVRGYIDLLTRGGPGEVYNLGSGRARSIAEIVELYGSLLPFPISRETDPALARPVDVPVSVADITKAHQATGWQPQIPFRETLEAILNEWRGRVREKAHV